MRRVADITPTARRHERHDAGAADRLDGGRTSWPSVRAAGIRDVPCCSGLRLRRRARTVRPRHPTRPSPVRRGDRRARRRSPGSRRRRWRRLRPRPRDACASSPGSPTTSRSSLVGSHGAELGPARPARPWTHEASPPDDEVTLAGCVRHRGARQGDHPGAGIEQSPRPPSCTPGSAPHERAAAAADARRARARPTWPGCTSHGQVGVELSVVARRQGLCPARARPRARRRRACSTSATTSPTRTPSRCCGPQDVSVKVGTGVTLAASASTTRPRSRRCSTGCAALAGRRCPAEPPRPVALAPTAPRQRQAAGTSAGRVSGRRAAAGRPADDELGPEDVLRPRRRLPGDLVDQGPHRRLAHAPARAGAPSSAAGR